MILKTTQHGHNRMNDITDPISEALGTETGIELVEGKTRELKSVHKNNKDNQNMLSDDFQYARENLLSILNQSMSLMPEAVSVARQTESARMYESVSGLIKIVSEINKDLLDISERNAKIIQMLNSGKEESVGNTTINHNNAVFVGSTEDLFKKLLSIEANDAITNTSDTV